MIDFKFTDLPLYSNVTSELNLLAALAERRVTTLMGDKVAARRKWIEENVKFRMGEDGSILESEDE